jgi:hypothetical protein
MGRFKGESLRRHQEEMKKRRQKVRIKSVSSVLLSILLVTSLIALLSFSMISQSVSATSGSNLPLNSSFESWSGGVPDSWTKEASVNISQESSIVEEGSYSVRFDTPTATNAGIYQEISVIAGVAYTWSAWLYSSGIASDHGMGIYINWRNSSGGSISSTPSVYNTLVNTWELVTTGPVIAPAGAVIGRAEIRAYKDSSSPAGYADNAKFSPENIFIKYCMPDLGQHAASWCWVAAAANSIYWYSQHGYLQLIDASENAVENDNNYITQMFSVPPLDNDNIYRLFFEIANDCGHGWNQGVLDNEYFYGLQKFMIDQGAPLYVHEIVNPALVSSPPPSSENVIYRSPTLMDYEMELENCQDVLLWLHYSNYNPPYYEDTDHVVTGVAFSNDNSWILVSDPWTTGSPDHNDNFDNKLYDNLKVLSTPESPLQVQYAGGPVWVSKMVYISPTTPPVPPAPVENFKMENMPDLGQHCENWCWTAAAANVFKWYYHNGYPKLVDDPKDNVLDENYLHLMPAGPSDLLGDNLPQLLNEIARDCLYPNVSENNENTIPYIGPNGTWCHPIDDNRYFYGLQKFIREQGDQFKVREILDNDHFAGPHEGLPPENIPPENDNIVIYEQPTFDNYKNLLKLGGVLLQLGFRNYNYETGNQEALDHIVTGVSYFDNGPGSQWMQVSDPWTPLPGPDHNDNEDLDVYDTLTVTSTDPLWVVYTGYTSEGPQTLPVPVVKLISISPVAVTENFTLHLVAGWNLVGFPLENESTTPTNLFGSNLKTMKYWTAPSGPYKDAPFGSAVQDNLGYWVQLKANQDVILSGMYPTSRTLYLVAGWNLVHFQLTSASTTPTNLFGSNLKTMKYWTAPSGPYKDAPFGSAVVPGVGYWVQLKANQSVTIPL